jgi:hypothetical protein
MESPMRAFIRFVLDDRQGRPLLALAFLALLLLFWMMGHRRAEAAAWALRANRWSAQDEKVYQDFVARLGESKYTNLNRFIRDPKSNPLYGEEDKTFNMYNDCADMPYLIRAYVAYKLRLPFSYVSGISSRGGDQRYARSIRPTSFRDQDYFTSPQKLFGQVTLVNSGYFRMTPAVEDGDFYPVRIGRDSIVPGTIYYDPNGHVAVVYQVTDDGRIRFIDAHPDQSISRPWFGSKFAHRTAENVGGFKRWRPSFRDSAGQVQRTKNHNIPDFSATDQFQKTFSLPARPGLSYFDYVRGRLAKGDGRLSPLREFQNMLEDIYNDLQYRVEAVEICLTKNIHQRPHPGSLPWNIYGTDGLWEEYSTPSRDARLKVAFRDLFERVAQMIEMAETRSPQLDFAGDARQLAASLLQHYDALTPRLTISYLNSRKQKVVLTFHDIIQRLFDLSFDPYHSPELRWGARGAELDSAPDDQIKRRWYSQEARLRNQLERVYNCPTPISLGPERPPEVDVRSWLQRYLAGQADPRGVPRIAAGLGDGSMGPPGQVAQIAQPAQNAQSGPALPVGPAAPLTVELAQITSPGPGDPMRSPEGPLTTNGPQLAQPQQE